MLALPVFSLFVGLRHREGFGLDLATGKILHKGKGPRRCQQKNRQAERWGSSLTVPGTGLRVVCRLFRPTVATGCKD